MLQLTTKKIAETERYVQSTELYAGAINTTRIGLHNYAIPPMTRRELYSHEVLCSDEPMASIAASELLRIIIIFMTPRSGFIKKRLLVGQSSNFIYLFLSYKKQVVVDHVFY